jgi:SAM-dependent methyltransferase
MSFKIYLWDNLNAVEWSQAVWKVEERRVDVNACRAEMIHEVIMKHAPLEGITVDAGSGTGRWPLYLRRLGCKAMGVEISHEGCVIGHENDPGTPFLQGDVEHMPLRSQSVDAVLSLGVVEHIEHGPVEALREAHRILKPHGVLILAVPYNNWFRRLCVNLLQRYVDRNRRRAGDKLAFAEYRFTKAEVRGFLRDAGFTPESAHPNDTYPSMGTTVGLWVDYANLFTSPLSPKVEGAKPLVLPGILGILARTALRLVPWLVCSEVAFVARKR